MVAKSPDKGQVIVGWYGNATVFKEKQKNAGDQTIHDHFCFAKKSKSVLLPECNRTYVIPGGKGGFGKTNVCYSLKNNGEQKSSESSKWIQKAIKFIKNYNGSNILFAPESDADREVTEAIEKAIASSQGQGFARDAKERSALESRAMGLAINYFKRKGYTVEDVSSRNPYDLLCRKNKKEIHVEVKGTTTDGNKVVITRNEFTHTQNNNITNALFIVHTMKIKNKAATGGEIKVINPWNPKPEHFLPISYIYSLSS
jgi:hypothetical protein